MLRNAQYVAKRLNASLPRRKKENGEITLRQITNDKPRGNVYVAPDNANRGNPNQIYQNLRRPGRVYRFVCSRMR